MLPEPNPDTPTVLTLNDCTALTADALAEHMAQGGLAIVVDGALSEWGSRVDDLLHKLEHSVLKWRSDGDTKTLLLRFVEPTLEPAAGGAASSANAAADEDVITFKAE